MHDLRLVGVHEDGEHLILTDTQGGRFLLPVDEPLRAAVRRDRAHLGQLQIEMDAGLRPRDVQARIRAGRSAEEVAAMAGWSVEKVRRYEGPVLAEREHVAQLARAVPVRRRGAESATLGALVQRRLSARGVDTDRVLWDAWRPEDGSWVVALTFAAGGRERQACWHVDVLARTVNPADDEARWLSEDEPDPSAGPIVGSSVAPMRAGRSAGAQPAQPGPARGGTVYDIEADGGVHAEPRRDGEGGPLDLVGAMRSRRREREGANRLANAARRRAPHSVTSARVGSTGDQADDVPGSTHPAGRRRSRPEPLELDPTLMDNPPAAHPPASQVPVSPLVPSPLVPTSQTPSGRTGSSTARRWPLADSMRQGPASTTDTMPTPAAAPPAAAGCTDADADEPQPMVPEATTADTKTPAHPDQAQAQIEPGQIEPGQSEPGGNEVSPSEQGQSRDLSGRHRGARQQAARRGRRPGVPSWDDIMFGTKRD